MSDIVEPRNDRGRLRPTRALGVAAVWRSCLLMLAFVGLGFATSPADAAWYDTNWQFRKSIIIDGTQVIGTQTDFPVLISITDADLAAAARADGFDILFTDDDGAAKLDHEIERYVSATGELVAWVKVPSISAAADKTIYMYYDYPAAADQQNVPGVWSNGYEAVYHLNDDFLDSTINVRNATNNGTSDIVGQVADGQDFNPIDDLQLGSWSVSGSDLTMQAWARFDDFNQDDPRVVSKATTSAEQGHVFMLGLGGTGENHLRMRVKTGTSDTAGTTTLLATSSPLTVNTWYHVAGTYDGAQLRLFRNGAQVANTPKTGSLRENGWEIWAGNNPSNTGNFTTYVIDGQLDELRISSASRSSAWLTTEYNNQSNPPTFYTLGIQAAPQSPMIFYVRTDGNDSNSGTTNSAGGAFLTIQKAADTMVAGDKTFVVTGTYNEEVVPLNGGTAINPIVYEALGDVILNGGPSLCYAFRVENAPYTTIDGFTFTNYLDCGGAAANVYFDNSANCQVLNNVFHDTGRDAIGFYGSTASCLVHNNLIYNMDDDGITPVGGGSHTFRNNTIFNVGVLTGASGWAMESAATAGNVYENNIFWDDIDNTGVATYSYNDYTGALPGIGNISANPLFINTGTGDFHLSQIAAGQGIDSPALDTGGVTAASLGLDTRTTRTDSVVDIGTVDMGYHYPNGIAGPGVCPSGGTVSTTTDSTTGDSLRACIIWANGNPGVDTLNVPAGTYTLTIAGTGENAAATGDLDITDGIIINGNSGTATIIDANGIDRVFEVLDASVTFSNLTIRGGNVTGDGGGIVVSAAGSLTLSASTVSGNTAADGGGISSAGTVALTNVTVSGNTASRGGGLNCSGPCTLTNVTVTQNTAPGAGDGVRQRTGPGSITFLNTIVANNGVEDCDGNAANLFSNGNNLSSDASCNFTNTGDIVNALPALGALADNGGPTFTHALLAASQAIDGGTNAGCPATDQRGNARPVNPNCDIGAYEYGSPVPPRADLSLSKIVDNANPIVGSNVVFTLTVTNAGPDDTTGVVATDLLPTGYTYVSDDAGGEYVPGTGIWTIGSSPLANGSNATLNITATVNSAGVYNNTAEITASNVIDPDSTPNNSVVTEDDYATQTTAPIPVAPTNPVVNSTRDVVDIAPGNGVCDTGALNTQGATECTLRAAIEEANALAGADTIEFNIPITELGYSAAPLSYTIQPGSALPVVTEQVVIDGSTQPDFPGTPIIVIDGVTAGAGARGLELNDAADGSTVRGLVINNFDGRGIHMEAASSTIAGNWIGLAVDGVTAAGNGEHGLFLTDAADNNTIGGTVAGDRNVISANNFMGMHVRGDNNVIVGNYIGTDSSGAVAGLGNSRGIRLNTDADGNMIGGTTAADANIIAGNSNEGIDHRSTGTANSFLRNSIHSNSDIGIDLANDGLGDANGADGVTANDASDGDPGANNLLNFPVITFAGESAGTLDVDFQLDVPAGDYRIEFFTNPSGADPSGNGEGEIYQSALTITHGGTGVESFSHTFAGVAGDILTTTATEEFAGPAFGATSEFGAAITAVIGLCPGGIVLTTADTGASSLRECIIYANGIPGTTITFDIPGPGNRSAGADSWWVISPSEPLPTVAAAATVIDATTQTTNQGDTNSRGPEVEIDGAGAGAGANGLVLGAAASGSTIRGLAVGNFSDNGILLLGDSNIVAGNYLGLSADGDTSTANNPTAANQLGGIRVESASNTIGGVTAADRNVISGNGFAGIELFGAAATANQVYGNYIGLDAGGTLDRGNTQEGIDLELAGGNIIGGPLPGQRNIISGNGSDGIEIDGGDSNVIQGNYIGTDLTGTVLIPNGRDGIDLNENDVDGAQNNLIGGTGANEGNLIRGNTMYGISVRDATVINNSILGNQIYENILLDIDLNDDGITANDMLDGDAGPNDLLNFPVIVAAPESAGTITAYFGLDVPVGDYRVEFFRNPPPGAHASGNGGGEVFVSSTTITHAGAGVEYFAFAFAGSTGDVITSTATEKLAGPTYNSTSEFSAAFTATAFTPFSARWPLDETSGVIAVDVDAGNNGTYQNGVLLNQLAACSDTGNAVYFDGVDDIVEVPHSADYLIDEGTVSFWAKADAFGTVQGLFSKDSTDLDTGGHLTIRLTAGGNVEVRLQSTTTSMTITGAAVSAGTWFHVAFSWGPAGMALYVDGAAPVTDPYIGGLGVTSGGTGNFEPIAFGAQTVISADLLVTPTTQFFAGYMDDVRIINRALTLPEIQTLATCNPNLIIIKRAFQTDGTPIPTGSIVPDYLEFKYLLYINNSGGARTDVSVRDVLDPAFQYQLESMQVDNSVAECAAAICDPAEELAIFTAVNGAPVLTDALGDDVVSYADPTIDAGNGNVGNLQLDINANTVWAILFSVKMP